MDFDGIVMVGGGIAGLATALALHRVGMKRILVLERAESLRTSGTAIGMWSNGWKALDALGVGQSLRQQHCLLQNSKLISRSDGTTVNIPIDTSFQELRFVKRALLLETLASVLPPEAIKFNCKVVDVRQFPRSKLMWEIELEDGSIIRAKGVIACDGVNSLLAESVLGLPRATSSAQCAVRGLSSYPEGHPFPPTRQLHMAEGFLMGIIPVTEKEVYWFISSASTPPGVFFLQLGEFCICLDLSCWALDLDLLFFSFNLPSHQFSKLVKFSPSLQFCFLGNTVCFVHG
ncbi:monooxygenase 1 isoform X2 [Cryptomeria japonica]|uniref:monooxygenase 1 isoform X2 n=1 Tax=Cryptomeria japonica TaxID=3369 RepID=UPI0025AC6D15|nr:monooxygenase 1 isoform X2 [Cryptomeria japonica]